MYVAWALIKELCAHLNEKRHKKTEDINMEAPKKKQIKVVFSRSKD